MAPTVRSFTLFPLALLAVTAAPAVRAQKMPSRDGTRIVSLHRVAGLLPGAPTATAGGMSAGRVQGLAALLRAAAAANGDAFDVQPLGAEHVAVLGTPPETAVVERLLEDLHGGQPQLFVDVKVCTVSDAAFQAVVAGRTTAIDGPFGAVHTATLLPDAWQVVLKELRAAAGPQPTIVQLPKLVAHGLQPAVLRCGKDVRAGAAETLFDGDQIEVVAARLADDRIAVHAEVAVQRVEAQTAGADRAAQSGSRVARASNRHSAVIANSGSLVQASRLDGDRWIVTFTTVHAIRGG